jgi:hypothetical protein
MANEDRGNNRPSNNEVVADDEFMKRLVFRKFAYELALRSGLIKGDHLGPPATDPETGKVYDLTVAENPSIDLVQEREGMIQEWGVDPLTYIPSQGSHSPSTLDQ